MANAIHQRSPRASRAMVAVNCAGLPETLLESELFGHVKGSFTGAYRDKQGKLEMADGGSIFLDEIGEMTLRMQGLLLRFMETGELQKVGADRASRPRQRARHRGHQPQSARHDHGGHVPRGSVLPPQRHSPDGAAAARAPRGHPAADRVTSWRGSRGTTGIRSSTSPPRRSKLLCEYSWPGNVRELENVIERLVVTGRNEAVVPDDLPMEIRMQQMIGLRPKRERRRTVADDLYKKLVEERESFWTVVYPLYMQREITRGNVRDLVRKGLEDARGNYKIVAKLFNMESRDYKRFLNFLRKHDCQLPFKEYRQ